MSTKVLVIEASLRNGSNTDIMAEAFAKGAKEAGNDVEIVSLKGKRIGYCRGCMACHDRNRCIIEDDSNAIVAKMAGSEVVVLSFPIYYYDMPGQMKTLIDRSNCLYSMDNAIRDVYVLMACSDTEASAVDGPLKGVSGWSACLPKTRIAGYVCAFGTSDPGAVSDDCIDRCEKMGKKV